MIRGGRLIALAAAALVAGCASLRTGDVAVTRDAVEVLAGDAGFSAARGAATAIPMEGELPWWGRFGDPALAEWVERALAANLESALAAERIEQARALLQQAQAARGPQLSGQAGLEWQLRGGQGSGDGAGRRLQPGAALGLDLDLDPWGGLQAAQRAAAAGLLRSEELAGAARLSAAGLAARAYLEWRLAQAEQRLLQDTVDVLREALRIVSVRVEAGLSPVLDRERAGAELASNEAALAAAAVRAGQALAALQVVAGMPPRPGPLELRAELPPVAAAAAAGPGAGFAHPARDPGSGSQAEPARMLPSLEGSQPLVRPLDLLRLRPDLRAAEQAVRVAAAEVGVAEADLLPRLRLPGTVVFGATSGGAVLGLASAVLAAALDVTLLDGGARAARRDAAWSRLREAGLAWQQALLQALQQVEGALLAQQGAAERIVAGRRSRDAARAAQSQAETLYRVGLTNYLDVVDAQRSALAGERLLLQAQAESAVASVRVFEAMGWMPPTRP